MKKSALFHPFFLDFMGLSRKDPHFILIRLSGEGETVVRAKLSHFRMVIFFPF
jgi:hypothetical protein